MDQRLADGDPGEAGTRFPDRAVVDADPFQPGLPEHVLGVDRRPEHFVGDGEQHCAMVQVNLGRLASVPGRRPTGRVHHLIAVVAPGLLPVRFRPGHRHKMPPHGVA
jgi:hypothetical protein